jgi:hypothetical protein
VSGGNLEQAIADGIALEVAPGATFSTSLRATVLHPRS